MGDPRPRVSAVAANRRPWLDVRVAAAAPKSVLFADEGALESLRWAGGLRFALFDLGFEAVLPMPQEGPAAAAAALMGKKETSGPSVDTHGRETRRVVIAVTGYLWEAEGSILAALLRSEADEVLVVCSVSSEAHKCHPLAAQLASAGDHVDVGSGVSFEDFAQQLAADSARLG